jgi:hypothetical protein
VRPQRAMPFTGDLVIVDLAERTLWEDLPQ